MRELDRRTTLRIIFGLGIALLLPGCADPLPNIPIRAATEGEKGYAGRKYPPGVLNQNIEVEGLCNVWMAGEALNQRQASGLPVNGETYAIATWRFSMGSHVTVINLDTGKSVVAVVTDRGPDEIKNPGHICDITPLVAREIAGRTGRNFRIRLSLASASSPAAVQPTPKPDNKVGNGVCVSNFNPSVTRSIGEPPHPGDQSRCVAGPNGEPVWVPR